MVISPSTYDLATYSFSMHDRTAQLTEDTRDPTRLIAVGQRVELLTPFRSRSQDAERRIGRSPSCRFESHACEECVWGWDCDYV